MIVNPQRLSYLLAGWKFLDLQHYSSDFHYVKRPCGAVDIPADPPPPGKEYRITGYRENYNSIWAEYKLVDVEPAPCTCSKLRLVNAFAERGIWPAFRDWLESSGYYDLFLAAQDFREDHPQFAAALSAAESRFGIDDTTAEAILAVGICK